MTRTREQLEQAAAEAEAWLNELDPATTPALDIRELAVIRAIVDRATTQCGLGAAIAEHFGADLPRTD